MQPRPQQPPVQPKPAVSLAPPKQTVVTTTMRVSAESADDAVEQARAQQEAAIEAARQRHQAAIEKARAEAMRLQEEAKARTEAARQQQQQEMQRQQQVGWK